MLFLSGLLLTVWTKVPKSFLMKNQIARRFHRESSFSKESSARFFYVLLCLLVALLSSMKADAGTLYATTSAGVPGELYIINPATGAMIQDIGPLNDSNSVNYPITGLAFHPVTGVLYGSTGNNPESTAARLVTINPATGLVTVIGSFNAGPVNTSGVPATMSDLAFDSAGNLYGVASIGGPQLYSINIATGQATVIGSTGLTSTSGGGLAINSAGTIYGSPTASRFGTYNSTSGAFTLIANPAKPVGGAYAALAFDESGVLYGLDLGPATAGTPSEIVTIDPVTGAVTDIGASLNFLDAIAFQPVIPPSLAIALTGSTEVTLKWPISAGFNLEYKTNLSSGTWLTNTTPPTLSNGTNSLILSADGSATFFRLHKP
jgi:hypothetical protein